MSCPVVLDIPYAVAAQLERRAAQAGMTASAWLSAELERSIETGRVILDLAEHPRRPSRSAQRRQAARRRAERAAIRAAAQVAAVDPTP